MSAHLACVHCRICVMVMTTRCKVAALWCKVLTAQLIRSGHGSSAIPYKSKACGIARKSRQDLMRVCLMRLALLMAFIAS